MKMMEFLWKVQAESITVYIMFCIIFLCVLTVEPKYENTFLYFSHSYLSSRK